MRRGRTGGPVFAGGETRVWAGTGWTGQPVVAQAAEGPRVMFGAYDRAVHFLEGDTGEHFLPDLPTGDLIKGTVMLDPDGYPLLYTGSRDNYFRVPALDREKPTVLWKMNANEVPHPVWNNDWDSSAVIVGDYLFEGGENSLLLHHQTQPGVRCRGEGHGEAIGNRMVSIENSPAVDLDPVRGDRPATARPAGAHGASLPSGLQVLDRRRCGRNRSPTTRGGRRWWSMTSSWWATPTVGSRRPGDGSS